MVSKSKFIGTTDTGKLSALGNFQQRDFNYIKSVLNDEDIIRYFAEPVLSENNEKIDWYTRVEGRPRSFKDLNEIEIKRTTDELNLLMSSLIDKADQASNLLDQQTIMNLTKLPDKDSIKLVGDQVTIINWAYQLHKSQKQKPQSEGFAGVVSPLTVSEDVLDNEENSIITNPSSKDLKSAEAILEPNPELNSTPETELKRDLKFDEPLENLIDGESSDEYKKSLGIFYNRWFWLVTFLLLLMLNLLMMKDACGVRSIPFLNFC
ncbi:hypothetical protein ACMAZE_12110 [Pseudopelagicola sp. nBUS_20]|uniref:hypothetical protein n=1 Tax=Pseudopelagicola sp. nBUS_20 TaxID=3395317 RepID=UPI003EBF1201